MENSARELCYKHYKEEESTKHKMEFLDILIEMLLIEKQALQKSLDGPQVAIAGTRRGSK